MFSFGLERPSPSDIVPEASITTTGSIVTVDLAKLNISFTKPPQVWIPSVPDTGSMDPSFDLGHNNILIAGADEVDHQRLINFLKVGDIAVYRHPNLYAIHRIVKIGKDKEGRYFRFKGDNNFIQDPYKVRDNMITYLCIGTIF